MPDNTSIFSSLDWGVVALYFVGMIFIGWWTGRGQSSQRDYFLGGRNLPWWAVGLSIIATETSALTFIGIPAAAFGTLAITKVGDTFQYSASGGNMFFMMIVIGYITGRLIIIKWIIPKYFTGEIYTTYELINHAFGRKSRYTVAALSSLGILAGAGVRVFATAIPLSILMTEIGIPGGGIFPAILAIMIAALIYTTLGGIKAVVWTDMAQFVIFLLAGLFTVFYIPTLLTGDLAAPSGATGWSAIWEMTNTPEGPLKVWNSGLLPNEEGASFFSHQMRNFLNFFTSPFNFVMGLIAAPFGIVLAFGFDQMNVQRVLACKNAKEGRKAMLSSAVLIGPQFFLFLMIGVCLFAFYQITGFDFQGFIPADPSSIANAENGIPAVKSDYIYPIFIFTQMPVVIKGFLIAALLSAAMSSVSSALSALGSMALVDFYQPFVGKEKSSHEKGLWVSRVAVLVSGILLCVIAIACAQGNDDLITLAFKLTSITGGPVMGMFLFGFIKKKSHYFPAIAGVLLGFAFMIWFNFDWLKHSTWIISWPWHVPVGVTMTLIFSFIADGAWAVISPNSEYEEL